MTPDITSPLLTRSGYLLVDKPSGPTSYDVIRWIKRKINDVKIGHCGTLDPLASGLLIILLGRKATRIQSRFMSGKKVYRCKMKLGTKTDTGDITGRVVQKSNNEVAVNRLEVEEVLKRFLGKREQVPPMFSALKKDGVPLYKLARRGELVARNPRTIEIESIELLNFNPPAEIEFRLTCSGGTYVRVLVEEIGEELKYPATMTGLVREGVGPYHLAEAVSGEKLKFMEGEEIWRLVKEVSGVWVE